MDSIKQYLWNYEITAYTDGTSTTTTPVIIGRWGQNGEDGSSYTENLLLDSKYRHTYTITAQGDHYYHIESASVKVEKGVQYTVSAKTNGVFSGRHQDYGKNNIVLWLRTTQPGNSIIISGSDMTSDGSVGHTFTWNQESTECVLRINVYDVGTWWVEEVKIEKGSNPHPVWTPNSSEMIGKDGAGLKKIDTKLRGFTASQWQFYGTVGHSENWNTGTSYNNSHIKIGDTGYIIGKVIDMFDSNGNQVDAALYGTVTAINGSNGSTSITMTSTSLIMGGAAGKDGAIQRVTEWQAGKDYYSGGQYIDIVAVTDSNGNPTYYNCIKDNTSSASNKPGTTGGNTYWSVMNSMQPIVTPMIFAENAYLKVSQTNGLRIVNNSGRVIGYFGGGSTPLWIGSSTASSSAFRVNSDGSGSAARNKINWDSYGNLNVTGSISYSSALVDPLSVTSYTLGDYGSYIADGERVFYYIDPETMQYTSLIAPSGTPAYCLMPGRFNFYLPIDDKYLGKTVTIMIPIGSTLCSTAFIIQRYIGEDIPKLISYDYTNESHFKKLINGYNAIRIRSGMIAECTYALPHNASYPSGWVIKVSQMIPGILDSDIFDYKYCGGQYKSDGSSRLSFFMAGLPQTNISTQIPAGVESGQVYLYGTALHVKP